VGLRSVYKVKAGIVPRAIVLGESTALGDQTALGGGIRGNAANVSEGRTIRLGREKRITCVSAEKIIAMEIIRSLQKDGLRGVKKDVARKGFFTGHDKSCRTRRRGKFGQGVVEKQLYKSKRLEKSHVIERFGAEAKPDSEEAEKRLWYMKKVKREKRNGKLAKGCGKAAPGTKITPRENLPLNLETKGRKWGRGGGFPGKRRKR